MNTRTRRISAILLGATALGALTTLPVLAESVKLTFLGVGDAYAFAEEDGRGGFAKLNAVAKAERAANPNTLYVFDGDMLSPSLLSGFDKGQNTIDLTNLEPFDIAVPGNHEFDFGPENFFEKMAASNYPWAAINITNADGSPIEGLGGVMMKDVGGVMVALIPVAQDTSPVTSSTGDLKFLPTVGNRYRRSQAGARRWRRPCCWRCSGRRGERPRSAGQPCVRSDLLG